MKLLPALFLLLPLAANAATDTDYKACVENQPNLCATLQFTNPANTIDEGMFAVTVETPDQGKVEDFALNLWMKMGSGGHPGAPVDVNSIDQNHYQVSNAWFFMEGTWLIQMNFRFENKSYHLEIPLNVKQ